MSRSKAYRCCWIQFMPPHGGFVKPGVVGKVDKLFQFTPPHGGFITSLFFEWIYFGFNSRPRMGASPSALKSPFNIMVSIHAPAWGLHSLSNRLRIAFLFQFTPPHGGFPQIFPLLPRKTVSIHAPAWGLRTRRAVLRPFRMFQFTPPHGGFIQAHQQSRT